MFPQKQTFLLLIASCFLSYITACIISDSTADLITPSEIKECFHSFIQMHNPTDNDIFEQLQGTWELDPNDQTKQIEFFTNGTYRVYDNNFIIENTKFKILKTNSIFSIKSIPNENPNIDGVINICHSDYVWNETLGKIWVRRW